VVRAIREQNIQAAAGVVGASPGLPGVDMQLSINAQGRLQSEEEFGDIIVKTDKGGAVTRLRDISRLELGASDYALRSLLDNKQAVAVPVFAAPGSNAIQISDDVQAVMKELKKNMPEGVDYEIVYDTTQFVRSSIEAVVHTLLEAVALVVLVVIIFLQTWRASIIPLLAVPISVIGTFAVMHLFGFSINALSLFGLVLAIGIVVDDAIVVVENVERNIEAGLSPRDATYRAMREVSGPIIAIALVLIAVFVPLAFITGLSGQFYKQFALTIAISTVISAINSLTQGCADPRHGQGLRPFLRRLQQGLPPRLRELQPGREGRDLAQGRDAGHLPGAGAGHHGPVQGRAQRLCARPGQAVPDRFRAAA
jgi:multidrug efflux pump